MGLAACSTDTGIYLNDVSGGALPGGGSNIPGNNANIPPGNANINLAGGLSINNTQDIVSITDPAVTADLNQYKDAGDAGTIQAAVSNDAVAAAIAITQQIDGLSYVDGPDAAEAKIASPGPFSAGFGNLPGGKTRASYVDDAGATVRVEYLQNPLLQVLLEQPVAVAVGISPTDQDAPSWNLNLSNVTNIGTSGDAGTEIGVYISLSQYSISSPFDPYADSVPLYRPADNMRQTGVDPAAKLGAYVQDVEGSALSDFIRGNDSDNIISGGLGVDFLHGGDGDDELYGGFGDDELEGGEGSDYLHGGAGSDNFVLDLTHASSTDRVADFTLADDTITILVDISTDAGNFPSTLAEAGLSVALVADPDGGADPARSSLVRDSDSAVVAEFDNVTTTELASATFQFDSLQPSPSDIISTEIRGTAGDHTLNGTDGDDTLDGGDGDDTLDGGAGDDTLIGGAGADGSNISQLDGVRTVTDFNISEGDTLRIDNGGIMNGFGNGGGVYLASTVDGSGTQIITISGSQVIAIIENFAPDVFANNPDSYEFY